MSAKQKAKNRAPIMPHPWKTLGFELAMYVLCVLLGLMAALRMREIFEFYPVEAAPRSVWEFVLPFLLVTGFLLLIIYLARNRKFKALFFKVFFLSAIAFGNLYFFGLWFGALVVFPLIAVLLFLLVKKLSLVVHNLALIIAMAGMGSAIGSQFAPQTIALLFLVFALYDFIAVYKTKHMVKMAEAMVENKAIVGLVIPCSVSDLQTDLNKAQIRGRFLVLGGGDVIFPLMFAVSMLRDGIGQFFIIAGFALLGLLAVFLIFIFKKARKPMPALPPIALASIIGYFLTMLM